jgi:flagellar assembly factor FliW
VEITTRHFGRVTIDEEKIVTFDKGIFGFETSKRFIVLLEGDVEATPFTWLQSLDDSDICLPLINPMMWFSSYTPDVDDELVASIGEMDQELLDVFTVVVIPDDVKDMTTNLRAPIIVNRQSHKGIQVIVNDEEYGIKHNLYDQLKSLAKEGE